MASIAATKRLTKEFKTISANPPPYITAHPSEHNILEWHYIITGPPDTPYVGGQYWGTLTFPPDYPFAPPAIRMHTPSGRFQPSTRLCLSISDFHPKSFNPAWEVSTILIGLLSFMTSEEMTTGSVRASESERKLFANRTRWWNSTGGGSSTRPIDGTSNGSGNRGAGAIRAGDGGSKFRTEWPDLDKDNWEWMKEHNINPLNGSTIRPVSSCTQGADVLRTNLNSRQGVVVEGAQNARNAGQTWLQRNKLYIIGGILVVYVVVSRMIKDAQLNEL
jgi:ubiquitin-conjugating enzyme E2 J2